MNECISSDSMFLLMSVRVCVLVSRKGNEMSRMRKYGCVCVRN